MDLTITWETPPGKPMGITYYVNGTVVGEDNEGFDRILETIRGNKNQKVVLRIARVASLGGESLRNSLPFKSRFADLEAALGSKQLVYEFFSTNGRKA